MLGSFNLAGFIHTWLQRFFDSHSTRVVKAVCAQRKEGVVAIHDERGG